MNKLRLFIVEDQALLLSALSTLLGQEPDFEIVGTAENGEQAKKALAEISPHVVLSDIEMPVMNGIALTEHISEQYPDCKTIILTTFARTGYLQRVLKAGAAGYLLKDKNTEHLVDAIRRVVAGETVVAPELAVSHWVDQYPLTDRERQILVQIESGATTAEISKTIHLSEGTVRNYLSEAISKLNAKNRVDAARIARKQGWL